MKNSLTKKLIVACMVLTMIFSLTACTEKAPAGEAMTEEEYVAKVQSLYDSMQEISTNAFANVDPTDQAKVVEATKKMAEDVKPLYVEMGQLVAPEKFADAQKKLTSGTEASVKMLDLSLEMIEMGSDPSKVTDQAAADKLAELQKSATELTTETAVMTEALTEILGV